MNGFLPSSPFSFRVTPHVTAGELAKNQEARRFQLQHQCDTAVLLCEFMEQVRSHFGGKPVVIDSGFRPPAVNRAIGGATKSEHLYNDRDVGAVDFHIAGVSVFVVQDYCDKQWPYSIGYGAAKGFVHLGMRKGRPRVRWNY
jgi:uncharacterized protein YcbK (DUF882 family)